MLGTFVEIRAGTDASGETVDIHAAIDGAFAVIEHVHRRMGFHDPQSDVSRLNREACHAPVPIDPHTYAVMEAAQHFAQLSDGAFDITIAPQLEHWRLLPPTQGPVSPMASWRDIELLGHRWARFNRPLHIDLGGIAKGYAVDQAVAALREAGVARALVNAGGDARALGTERYRIALRDPRQPWCLAQTLPLQNSALATSAAYFTRRAYGAKHVSALLDPHSRRPYTGAASISVQAPDCLTADALTKVVLFADRATTERILTACDAHSFVLCTDTMTMRPDEICSVHCTGS